MQLLTVGAERLTMVPFPQKLSIPTPLHPMLARPALIDRLEQIICSRQVVVLAAPAGWGKTTALAAWAQTTAMPTAWYALDQLDRNPRTFLDYLLQAIDPLVPEAAMLAQRLRDTPVAPADLLHDAAAAIATAPQPFTLILDDFHILDGDSDTPELEDAPLFTFLGALMNYSTQCHLVLASRVLPARSGLARMVVQRRAAVVDYATLQFSAAELQRLVAETSHVLLPDQQAAQMIQQFNGWAAGIALILDQVQRDPTSLDSLDLASTATFADFVEEQILAPLSLDLQQFLEAISVVDDLSIARCTRLWPSEQIGNYFDDLRRRGLFTLRRENWLALHSLFRDVLRARLLRDPQRARMVFGRAAAMYRDEDDLARAVDCLLIAQEPAEVIALLRETAQRYLQRSQHMTLAACFERLRANRDRAFPLELPPDLLLVEARLYRDLAQWDRVDVALHLADRQSDPLIQAEVALLRADVLLLQHSNSNEVISQLQQQLATAEAALQRYPNGAIPSRLIFIRDVAAGRLATRQHNLTQAIAIFDRALTNALADRNIAAEPSILADLADNLGFVYAMNGDRPAARRTLMRADALWQSIGNNGRRTMTLNNLGMLSIEERRYDDAQRYLDEGIALAKQTGRRREYLRLKETTTELVLLEGPLSDALSSFVATVALAQQLDRSDIARASAAGAALVASITGDAAAWDRWEPMLNIGAVNAEPHPRALLAHSYQAAKANDWQQVKQLLVLLSPALEQITLPIDVALSSLLKSLACQASGEENSLKQWSEFATHAQQLLPTLLTAILIPFWPAVRAALNAGLNAAFLQSLLPKEQSTNWQITTLGSFVCRVNSQTCKITGRHRTLLIRLLDAGPRGVPLDSLWEDVWGDEPLISMNALHSALSRLRTQTLLDIVVRDGQCSIQSDWTHISFDLAQLQQALAAPLDRDTLDTMITLYTGDVVAGDTRVATSWSDNRRIHIREQFLYALEAGARLYEPLDPEYAIHLLQQVLTHDNCREQAATQLMRLAARFGRSSLASTTFDILSNGLRTIGEQPDDLTQALYRQIHT